MCMERHVKQKQKFLAHEDTFRVRARACVLTKKKIPEKITVLTRPKKKTTERKELNAKDQKKCGTPTKKSG